MTAPSASIAAVVVSFNRRDRLQREIKALRNQTRPVDEIIAVDNGSTDGSREFLRSLGGSVLVVESHRNRGGAGGFALGLAWALHRGHDLAWLMDDDAEPYPDCLAELLVPFGGDPQRFSFTCPQVVDPQGRTGPRNHPLLSGRYDQLFSSAEQGYLAVAAASFVGPLISLHHARRTHLPLADFFVWHDDTEYTSRLAALAPAVAVPNAKIIHLPDSAGPRVFDSARAAGNIRNLLWWYRQDTDSTIPKRVIARWTVSIAAANVRSAGLRGFLPLLAKFGSGVVQSVVRRPAHRGPEELVDESARDDAVVVT